MYLADVGYSQETGSGKDIFLLIFTSMQFLGGLGGNDTETEVRKQCSVWKLQNSLTAGEIRNVYELIRIMMTG